MRSLLSGLDSDSGAFRPTWRTNSPIPGYEAYLDRIVSLHPDTELRTSVLDYALSVAYYAGDTVMAQSLYERLQSDFPDSRAAATAAKLLAPDRRIRVGELVPEFRITSLDIRDRLSRSSLLAAPTLIDFWPPCGRAWQRCRAFMRPGLNTGIRGSRS